MDLLYAWRGLKRAPGFSALVILTLALAIGATATAFSAVWAVALRPLPFPAQDRLVTVWQSDPRSPDARMRVTPANFVDWEAQTTSFDALGVLPNWDGKAFPFNVAGRNGSERVQGTYASSGFFAVMGIPPALGRTLDRNDDRARGRRSVVISHSFWQARFGADPSVVGQTLDVDTFRGGTFTVVGVMPPAFDFPAGASLWLSLGDWGGGPMPQVGAPNRCCPWYTVLGRLKPGVTIEQARLELTAIARSIATTHPDGTAAPAVQLATLRETLVGSHRLTLFGLFGGVGCILLIGVANVANLLLARGVSRRREVLTRLALGATRWRLARSLLTEGLLLGAIGATLGLLVSLWAQGAVRSAWAERVPLIDATRMDGFVLAFTIGLTLLVSAACGLTPLLDWRGVEWRARGQTESPVSHRVRHTLVVAEIALAVALVASAGLLVRSVANLRGVMVGFDTTSTLVVATDLTTSALRERGSAARFVQDVVQHIAALPGVNAVGATTGVPLEGGPAGQAITRQGDQTRPAALSPQVMHTAVTPDYFHAMGIALTSGRMFTEDDGADGVLVALLNETAARRYWPGENPIGKQFAIGSLERFGSFRQVGPAGVEWRQIIGVVADIRSGGFAADVQPEVFYNYKQFPLYDPSLIVRTAGAPATIVQAIRTEIATVNKHAVITKVRTLDDVAEQSIANPLLRARLATMFSALALMLGMLGIYGLMSYTVAQRTREIGLRMALGARRSQVARMIAGKALRLTAAGAGLGLVIAYVVARWISSVFFGVGPADAGTLAATCLLLVAAAALATVQPARRAVRIEPAEALKND